MLILPVLPEFHSGVSRTLNALRGCVEEGCLQCVSGVAEFLTGFGGMLDHYGLVWRKAACNTHSIGIHIAEIRSGFNRRLEACVPAIGFKHSASAGTPVNATSRCMVRCGSWHFLC
jgi:hypothetical protein